MVTIPQTKQDKFKLTTSRLLSCLSPLQYFWPILRIQKFQTRVAATYLMISYQSFYKPHPPKIY